MTPFTRSLADGHPGTVGTLNRILTNFRTRVLDPYRRRITSAVATASATAGARAAIGGIDDMLNSPHPSIRWEGHELRLDTLLDAEESLEGRPLIFQPTALASRIVFDPLADRVTVIYPTIGDTLTPRVRARRHTDAAVCVAAVGLELQAGGCGRFRVRGLVLFEASRQPRIMAGVAVSGRGVFRLTGTRSRY